MKIEVSLGEIVDKLSILEIKKQHIKEKTKLNNIEKEYNYLYDITFNILKIKFSDYSDLLKINQKLWDIEDKIREKESLNSFDDEFIQLSRSVYITNDKRFKFKTKINIDYNSNFIEEKSYRDY